MATFSFEIEKKYLTHLIDISYYNHNYYKINLKGLGDWFWGSKCDILCEEYEEYSNTFTYSVGYMEGNEYQKMFAWTEYENKL